MQETIDQQYYEVARPGTAAGRIMMRARENMYDEFAALVRPIETESILDVGVSDIQTDGANWFEARYPGPRIETGLSGDNLYTDIGQQGVAFCGRPI